MSDIVREDEVKDIIDEDQQGKKVAGNKVVSPDRDINTEYQKETRKEKLID
ncbi:MAG: hypothetical protein M3250_05635 [Thermoproteota archaeon]|jgi:hypothetical protein|nr:hypothetical protein [Thermoproteota archaeon]